MQEIIDPFRLQLRDDLQEKIDTELIRICQEVVLGNRDRDWDLRQCRMQLEGWSQPQRNQRWPGSCQVEAPISREVHTTVCAAIDSATRQTPYVAVEPVDPDGQDAASSLESYLTIKAQQYGYDKARKDAIYLAGEGRYAPIHVSIYQPRSVQFVPNETGDGVDRIDDIGEKCLRFRTLDPWDIYAYPIEACGPQPRDGATLIFERMALTDQELMMGVVSEGYDKDKVAQMLKMGPATDVLSEDDGNKDEWERDGLNSAAIQKSRGGGHWYCYQVIGRMPLVPDEEGVPQIPEELEFGEFLWMICPAHNIVFKQAYATHEDNKRPYALVRMIKKPNRWCGEGPVSIVTPMHEEMTATIRFFIDNMNLEASPCIIADERWKMKYPNWTIAPGRVLPRMPGDQVGPKPFTWDIKSQGLVLQSLDRLYAWASRMAATEGMSQLQTGKVLKSAQVHAAEAMQQSKFDLLLNNVQEGFVEVFEIVRSLLAQHISEDGDTAYAMGQEAKITKEMMNKEVRFFPVASSDSMTAASRLAKQQAVAQIVMSYWQSVPMWVQLQQQTGQPVMAYMWHLHHRLLVLAQERSPERFIGPDPSGGQMQQGPSNEVLQALSALLNQGGLQGGGGGGGIPGAAPQPQMQGPMQMPGMPATQMMGGGMQQASPLGENMLNGAGV